MRSFVRDTSKPGTLEHTLRDVFGFREFRPLQREIIEHLVAGGDAFVLMPTGGGKSLCFQIPALRAARHGASSSRRSSRS